MFDDSLIINEKKITILSLLSNSKIIHCERFGKYTFYNSDRYGFYNKDSNWNNKNDTVIVGDSFGVSECVQESDSISNLLSKSKKINGLINLSVTGNGPLMELATFLEYGKKFKPKNLIWLYFEGNDILELDVEKKNKNLLKYVYEEDFNQNLINIQNLIDNHHEKFIKKRFYEIKSNARIKQLTLELIYLRNFRALFNLTQNNSKYLKIDNLFFETIFKANSELKSWGGKLYFIYLPTRFRHLYPDNEQLYENSRKEIIKNLKKRNIKVIDFYELIYLKENNKKKIYDEFNGHFTVETYMKISNEIISNID